MVEQEWIEAKIENNSQNPKDWEAFGFYWLVRNQFPGQEEGGRCE
jgi:hypothetical protein